MADIEKQEDVEKISTISEEELIKTWIGDKQDVMYPKMCQTAACSGWTLLFGVFYMAYRKMYLIALVIWVINIVIFNVVSNPIFTILVWIAYGFLFYPLYKWDIKRKLNSFRYQHYTEEQIKALAEQKGGTSKGVAIGLGIVFGVIIVLFIVTSLILGLSLFNATNSWLSNYNTIY